MKDYDKLQTAFVKSGKSELIKKLQQFAIKHRLVDPSFDGRMLHALQAQYLPRNLVKSFKGGFSSPGSIKSLQDLGRNPWAQGAGLGTATGGLSALTDKLQGKEVDLKRALGFSAAGLLSPGSYKGTGLAVKQLGKNRDFAYDIYNLGFGIKQDPSKAIKKLKKGMSKSKSFREKLELVKAFLGNKEVKGYLNDVRKGPSELTVDYLSGVPSPALLGTAAKSYGVKTLNTKDIVNPNIAAMVERGRLAKTLKEQGFERLYGRKGTVRSVSPAVARQTRDQVRWTKDNLPKKPKGNYFDTLLGSKAAPEKGKSSFGWFDAWNDAGFRSSRDVGAYRDSVEDLIRMTRNKGVENRAKAKGMGAKKKTLKEKPTVPSLRHYYDPTKSRTQKFDIKL